MRHSARTHFLARTEESNRAVPTIYMSTFIVRIELHPSDQEQAYSAVHTSMEKAGFSRIYRADDGIRYHLPASEYCIKSISSAETIRELAKHAAEKVTSLFMLLVSDTTKIAIAGLVPVKEAVLPTERPMPLHSAAASVA